MKTEFEDAIESLKKANRNNSSKAKPVWEWANEHFGIAMSPPFFDARLITSDNQIGNRLGEQIRKNQRVQYLCLVRHEEATLERIMAVYGQTESQLSAIRMLLIWDGAAPSSLVVYEDDNVTKFFQSSYPNVKVEHRARSGGGSSRPRRYATTEIEISIPDRTRRMIAVAIAAARSVLLVGPPGTGKTALIKDAADSAALDARAYGLVGPINEPILVTPEESWTTRELLGGDTVTEDGELVFHPGTLLQALINDSWLVLDEANRADLDRIFGGALSWLAMDAGQHVTLGRTSNRPTAGNVLLAWSSDAHCHVTNLEGLGNPENTADVVFAAGTDWRLLGTYNAQDAQRVFRFGQALGRRFVRVPIPPLAASDFPAVLDSSVGGLTEEVKTAVVGMYKAHLESAETVLGPAIFIRIADFLAAATDRFADVSLEDLAAESYLSNVGAWVAMLEDSDIEALYGRLNANGVFERANWDWIVDQAKHLG